MNKNNFNKYLSDRFDKILFNIKEIDEAFYKSFSYICKESLSSIKNRGKIITFGNGGSASDAMHLSGELVGKFKKNRPPINSVCLNTNMSIITSIANDIDYSKVFARQLEACIEKNDIVLAISTSGKSKNILECIKYIKKKKIKFFLFTGNEYFLKSQYINTINVPSNKVDEIQELFFIFMHSYCECLENSLNKKN